MAFKTGCGWLAVLGKRSALWCHKFLSLGGRMVLLKAVLRNLMVFLGLNGSYSSFYSPKGEILNVCFPLVGKGSFRSLSFG